MGFFVAGAFFTRGAGSTSSSTASAPFSTILGAALLRFAGGGGEFSGDASRLVVAADRPRVVLFAAGFSAVFAGFAAVLVAAFAGFSAGLGVGLVAGLAACLVAGFSAGFADPARVDRLGGIGIAEMSKDTDKAEWVHSLGDYRSAVSYECVSSAEERRRSTRRSGDQGRGEGWRTRRVNSNRAVSRRASARATVNNA